MKYRIFRIVIDSKTGATQFFADPLGLLYDSVEEAFNSLNECGDRHTRYTVLPYYYHI